MGAAGTTRNGRTEVTNDDCGLAIFFGELGCMLGFGEEREFGQVCQKVQAAVMRHLDEDVFHAGLCLYALSGNVIQKHKARRTLSERPEERIRRREHQRFAPELTPKFGNLELREVVEHLRACQQHIYPLLARRVCRLRLCELTLEQMRGP